MAGKQQVVEDVAITSENREEVITKYSPMIKYVANRIAMRLPPHVEVDDLISVGVLGFQWETQNCQRRSSRTGR